jgi:hypothetical protein
LAAFKAAKLWLVVVVYYPLVARPLNLDAALFVSAARAGVVVTNFIDTHYDREA